MNKSSIDIMQCFIENTIKSLQTLESDNALTEQDKPCVPSYIADYALPHNFADYTCRVTGQSCRACTYFCKNRIKQCQQ